MSVALLALSLASADPARVLMLDLDAADHRSALRRVEAAVGPDAVLVPGTDLHQQGRRADGGSTKRIAAVVAGVAAQPAGGEPEGWKRSLSALTAAEAELGFVDTEADRLLLFQLYLQAARAVHHGELTDLAWSRPLGDVRANLYGYLAARMVHESPELDERVTPDVRTVVERYEKMLADGDVTLRTVSFEEHLNFAPRRFATEYVARINGREVLVHDVAGFVEVGPGPVHIAMERMDGQSLSHRDDALSTDWVYPRNAAYDRVVLELPEQLDSCVPVLDASFVHDLATYDALHPNADTWVAVGRARELYRWDPVAAQLDCTRSK